MKTRLATVLVTIVGLTAPVIAATDIAYETMAPLAVGEAIAVRLDASGLDLELERFSPLAPDARVVVAGPEGQEDLRPPVVLLRGHVADAPTRRVFLAVSPDGAQGFLHGAGGVEFLETGAPVPALVAAAHAAVPPSACGTDATDDGFFPHGRPVPAGVADPSDGGPVCRVATVAVETDWEFTDMFGGDPTSAAVYALTLMAGVSEIYEDQVNTRLLVSFLRVWSANVDPYSPGGGDLLAQFRVEWNESQTLVERTTAHLLSGRSDLPYGGVAFVSALCGVSGYGVSAYLNGSFPYPLQDNHPGNWDLVVVSHELGHNFGTLHTHDGFSPPIDGCGLGDCSSASDGTIMSYCHTCSGGISNIALAFHPLVRETILGYLDGIPGCGLEAADTPVAADDEFNSYEGLTVALDVLLNDAAETCDPASLELMDFDAATTAGGGVALAPANELLPRAHLVYSAPDGHLGSDTFTYTLDSGDTATVTVLLDPLRPADVTGPVDPGVTVAYYDLDDPMELPDFSQLEPYASDVVTAINYSPTSGQFATSGQSNRLGAVFAGYVDIPEDGVWTFYTNSNDGSKLWIGDQGVVSNGGTHGMRERAGSMPLEAGRHELRVEFFERTGQAGLIVSYEGPGVSKQPIPGSGWSHGSPCPTDLDDDGATGFTDLLAILSSWGPCPDCPQDLDQSGDVGFTDLLGVLSSWGPCE
ncbi:MAG: hypothetical protein HKO59_07075 [Phycisphaerales bacterium]|nr:hypothetical protein [Phycisphaerales bacterium]NNM25736.1 hypothetical protein [Phycisphaerales bacterium]